MFYSVEILSLRRKGKLARCWLAATLSERLFKKKVSNKIIMSIDITVTCDEILKVVKSKSKNATARFSLYMSSQLMYGVAKLFRMQVAMFQALLFKTQMDLMPVDMGPSKKKRSGDISTSDSFMLVEPPPVNFGDLQLREDLHLMPEVELEMIDTSKLRDYVESPNFGALTEEEFDFMFCNDGDIRTFVSSDSHTWRVDESAEQPRSPGQTTETHNLGLSDAPQVPETSVEIERVERQMRTPQKRISVTKEWVTPTKRRRASLRDDFESVADIRPDDPLAYPPDVDIHPLEISEPPTNFQAQGLESLLRSPPEVSAIPALPAPDRTDAPQDSDLHLETLELQTPAPRRNRRIREVQRVDAETQLPDNQTGKRRCGNPGIYTIPFLVPPIINEKHGIPAEVLLAKPSTKTWANKLISNFDLHRTGPFVVDDELSISAEALRHADAASRLESADMSKRPGDTTTTTTTKTSSRNKTADTAVILESEIPVGRVHSESLGNILEPPAEVELADVTIDPVQDPTLPEVEVAPQHPHMTENASEAATVSVDKLHRDSAATNGKPESDPSTGDIDAFLPPKMRARSSEKIGHRTISTPKAIVDRQESLDSAGSQAMISNWTKPELIAYLEILWRDSRWIKLSDFLPPDVTRRIDAAVCFALLLELSRDGKVIMKQRDTYGDIYIGKRRSTESGRSREEA